VSVACEEIVNGAKYSTIQHIADLAGVSIQTVSRVINNRPDVAPATRRRVQEVIDRLGYQPNAIARGLVQQRTHTIGVVAAGLEFVGRDYLLRPSDQISIMPPVQGG